MMAKDWRFRPPHARHADRDPRTGRLLKRERQADATIERLPELLPATCPTCRVVLGLVEADGELLCRNCGRWVPADEILGWIANG